jgi:hypothetical protein
MFLPCRATSRQITDLEQLSCAPLLVQDSLNNAEMSAGGRQNIKI